jgi:hypothetical protein
MDNNQQDENEHTLMYLADSMASAATSFSAHGYDTFIQAREQFKDTLHKILADTKVHFNK